MYMYLTQKITANIAHVAQPQSTNVNFKQTLNVHVHVIFTCSLPLYKVPYDINSHSSNCYKGLCEIQNGQHCKNS